MNQLHQSPLGQPTVWGGAYDAALLCPIARAPQRAALGINGAAPFFGADLWTAFELSWLNPRGKPQVALAHITVPCETPNIIESKSLKLYLNSLSESRFADAVELQQRLRQDLGAALVQGAAPGAAGAGVVGVQLLTPQQFGQQAVQELAGLDLDRLDLECTHYQPAPELLSARFDLPPVAEALSSRLLKSNCPVTGQPDWASVQVRYSGPQIDQAGLLRYIVSFRGHQGFHEHCVERIFMDLMQRCKPARLSVYARYTRRGGLDINPLRSSHPLTAPRNQRTARQ